MIKGDTAYVRNVGFGYTTFEVHKVAKVTKKGTYLRGLDYPFDTTTGRQLCDLPATGLTVSICVTDAEIERAKKECSE